MLAYIDGLPTASRFKEALFDDPEVGRAILKAQEDGEDEEYHPALSSWSEEVSLLTDIKDGIQSAVHAIVASAGGKPKGFQAAPRPRTAIDVARDERSARIHDRILRLFAPHEL